MLTDILNMSHCKVHSKNNVDTFYPKTSCPCTYCNNNSSFKCEKGIHQSCSLPLSNCKDNFNLDYCSTEQFISNDIEPSQIEPRCDPSYNERTFKLYPLNNTGLELDSQNYRPVLFDNKTLAFDGNNQKLIDAMRAQKLILDRPNFTRQIQVGDAVKDEIYTKEYSKYGQSYTNYTDMNTGDIQYYVDPSIMRPYYDPVFTTPASVNTVNVKDPMDVVKPEYRRNSLASYKWKYCPTKYECMNNNSNKKCDIFDLYDGCDSRTHDELEFRQELMEKQQRKINQSRFTNRWF